MSAASGLPARIAGGAIGFVRRNPALIGVWAVVVFAEGLAAALLMRPAMARVMAAARGGTDAGAVDAMPLGGIFLSYLLTFGALIVLFNGAMRAVSQPDDRRWAYLRIGMDELRMLGVLLVVRFLGYVAMVIATLVLGIPMAMLAALVGGGQGAIAAMLFLVTGLLAVGGLYVGARISPAYPLTLARRRTVLRPAWRLTRGRGWALAGGYALIGLVCAGLMLIVLLPVMASGVLPPMSGPPDPERNARAFAAMMALTTGLEPMALVLRVAGAVVGALTIALPGAGLATALVALEDERGPAKN